MGFNCSYMYSHVHMCYRNRKTKAEDGELKIVDLPTIGKIAPDFLRLTMWGLFSRVAKFTNQLHIFVL